MLPKQLASMLSGLLLSGTMSLLVSGISTWRAAVAAADDRLWRDHPGSSGIWR
jgi:hypothetical protein